MHQWKGLNESRSDLSSQPLDCTHHHWFTTHRDLFTRKHCNTVCKSSVPEIHSFVVNVQPFIMIPFIIVQSGSTSPPHPLSRLVQPSVCIHFIIVPYTRLHTSPTQHKLYLMTRSAKDKVTIVGVHFNKHTLQWHNRRLLLSSHILRSSTDYVVPVAKLILVPALPVEPLNAIRISIRIIMESTSLPLCSWFRSTYVKVS